MHKEMGTRMETIQVKQEMVLLQDLVQNCGHGPNAHAGNANYSGGSDSIPLDGGLSILLAGAAVFGIRKLSKK